MIHLAFFLHRLGFRFEKVLYDDYRVPLVCRLGSHDLTGQGKCLRCSMMIPIYFL